MRMSTPLARSRHWAAPALPAGSSLHPWDAALLAEHAHVLAAGFAEAIDGVLFPNLTTRIGATTLLQDVTACGGFCPGATWLIRADSEPVAAIQGMVLSGGIGLVHNLAVVPAARGRGFAAVLLRQMLLAYRQLGLRRCELDVTEENTPAVRLYRRFGFKNVNSRSLMLHTV